MRYMRIEKLVFALFINTRKLTHYFQFFPIIVLTENPLRTIMENLKVNGRIGNWVAEIGPLKVTFEPGTTIK